MNVVHVCGDACISMETLKAPEDVDGITYVIYGIHSITRLQEECDRNRGGAVFD